MGPPRLCGALALASARRREGRGKARRNDCVSPLTAVCRARSGRGGGNRGRRGRCSGLEDRFRGRQRRRHGGRALLDLGRSKGRAFGLPLGRRGAGRWASGRLRGRRRRDGRRRGGGGRSGPKDRRGERDEPRGGGQRGSRHSGRCKMAAGGAPEAMAHLRRTRGGGGASRSGGRGRGGTGAGGGRPGRLHESGLGVPKPGRQVGCLLTERRGLASVCEIQENQDRQSDDRGEARIGPDRRDEIVDRQGERHRSHASLQSTSGPGRLLRPPSAWRGRAWPHAAPVRPRHPRGPAG